MGPAARPDTSPPMPIRDVGETAAMRAPRTIPATIAQTMTTAVYAPAFSAGQRMSTAMPV